MIETVILAAVIASVLHVVKARHGAIRGVWRDAAWWERAVLLLALAPVPGPFEELAGLLVARRVMRRMGATR